MNTTATKSKRQTLIELSQLAKIRQATDCEGMGINEILIDEFYTDAENSEFHTFHGWKEKGMNIKKGATAFLIWGKKRSSKQGEAEPQNDEEKAFQFFPVCYLFSNNQVEPQSDAKDR